jgi:hypothetical protein
MRRILTATALAAVAGLTAVGASAFADDGPANPPTAPPECPSPGYPDVAPTREAPRELPRECQDTGRPDGPGPGAEETPGEPSVDDPGSAFDDAFFTRFWRVSGEVVDVENTDNGWVVDFDVKKLLNPPKDFLDEGDEVADQGAYLKLSKSVKITADGKRIAPSDLEADDVLVVKGKFLDDVQWLEDEDGTPTPTMRVKRIWVK